MDEFMQPTAEREIDPQFACYLRDPPRVSYVQPENSWLEQRLITVLEVLSGRRRIERIYWQLKGRNLGVENFFEEGLRAASINIDMDRCRLAGLAPESPLVFVANHPFGVVDGMVLCDIAVKLRGNFRIMLHSLLCQDRQLAPYFLPIDFIGSPVARKTNIRSRQLAVDALARNIPLLIFPSGAVSTAGKMGFGEVREAPWTNFAAKIIRDAWATVVPVYFHGRNSRKFHIASHIAEPLRSALLIHEARNKFGKTLRVEVGDPIPWDAMQSLNGRQELTNFLYRRVQSLARARENEPGNGSARSRAAG